MAAPNQYSNAEVKAGLFLAFCLALFLGMLVVYGRVARFWRVRQDLHVALMTVGGLRPDASVRYNGVEVGRVKQMRILHMDQAQLRRLAPLAFKDLEDLPLTDAQRRDLRISGGPDFDAKVKEALRDKTMIELTLEVLQEGQIRRYLADDAVRLETTVMGDTFIEIMSGAGHGKPLGPGEDVLLLGSTGDFFSQLSRSMDQVKEVLSNVTDVVGGEERAAFRRATARLDPLVKHMDSMTNLAEKRMPQTSKRFTAMGDAGKRAGDEAKALFDGARKQGAAAWDQATAMRKDLSQRFTSLKEEGVKAKDEITAQTKPITADVRQAREAAEPHVEEMKVNFRGLSAKVNGIAEHAEDIQYVLGRAGEQSVPDLRKFMADIQQGVKHLSSLEYIREHTDQLIGRGDKGEHEFWTALEAYRGLRRIARWVRDVNDDLAELRGFAAAAPEGAGTASLQALDAARGRVGKIEADFEVARDGVAKAFLPSFQGVTGLELVPPFTRKRAGRQVLPSRP